MSFRGRSFIYFLASGAEVLGTQVVGAEFEGPKCFFRGRSVIYFWPRGPKLQGPKCPNPLVYITSLVAKM